MKSLLERGCDKMSAAAAAVLRALRKRSEQIGEAA